MKFYHLLLLLFPLLISCGPDYIFSEEYPVPEEGWAYEDTVDFNFTIEDTTALYNLFLELSHSTTYSYQNLYTKVYTTFPGGNRMDQLLSLELADKGGFWFGDCNSSSCNLVIPLQTRVYFQEMGQYVFTIEQYMRKSPIEGVRMIGLKVEKTTEKR